jgi:hypothetical protein
MTQSFRAALGHDFNRQAALEIRRRLLPLLELGFLGSEESGDEGVVLFLRQWTIDVVLAGAAGSRLVVTRLEPGDRPIDRMMMNDRRDRVEEGEIVLTGQTAQGFRQGRGGQGTGGDDHIVPFGRG